MKRSPTVRRECPRFFLECRAVAQGGRLPPQLAVLGFQFSDCAPRARRPLGGATLLPLVQRAEIDPQLARDLCNGLAAVAPMLDRRALERFVVPLLPGILR